MNNAEKLEMYHAEDLTDPIWLILFYLFYALFYIGNVFYLNKRHQQFLYNEYADPAIRNQLFFNRVVLISSILTLAIPLALTVPGLGFNEHQIALLEKLLFVLFSLSPHLILIALLENKTFFYSNKIHPKLDKKETLQIENILVLKTQLLSYMEQEKPFLNQNLTLQDLADQLGFSRSQLSGLINQGTQQNYYDFVNKYRLDTIVKRLKKGDHTLYSLDHIALESGFKSYVSFYRVFKKRFQQSPKAFIKEMERKL